MPTEPRRAVRRKAAAGRAAAALLTAMTLTATLPLAPAGARAQGAAGPAAPAVVGPGTGPAASPGSGPGAAAGAGALGTGQGYHSPQSAFPPLRDLPGVLPWSLFAEVSHRQEGKRSVPVFPAQLNSLSGTRVKVQGYMLPLQPGERQTHFLLSAVPTTCGFCLPAGPEGIIEIRTRGAGIKAGVDAMVLEGTLRVLPSDPMGLLYRLTDAQAAR